MNKDVDIKLLTLEGTKAYIDDLDAFFMAAVDNGSIGEAAVERREQVVSESMAYFPQSDNPDLSQLALRQSPHLRAVSSYPTYVWDFAKRFKDATAAQGVTTAFLEQERGHLKHFRELRAAAEQAQQLGARTAARTTPAPPPLTGALLQQRDGHLAAAQRQGVPARLEDSAIDETTASLKGLRFTDLEKMEVNVNPTMRASPAMQPQNPPPQYRHISAAPTPPANPPPSRISAAQPTQVYVDIPPQPPAVSKPTKAGPSKPRAEKNSGKVKAEGPTKCKRAKDNVGEAKPKKTRVRKYYLAVKTANTVPCERCAAKNVACYNQDVPPNVLQPATACVGCAKLKQFCIYPADSEGAQEATSAGQGKGKQPQNGKADTGSLKPKSKAAGKGKSVQQEASGGEEDELDSDEFVPDPNAKIGPPVRARTAARPTAKGAVPAHNPKSLPPTMQKAVPAPMDQSVESDHLLWTVLPAASPTPVAPPAPRTAAPSPSAIPAASHVPRFPAAEEPAQPSVTVAASLLQAADTAIPQTFRKPFSVDQMTSAQEEAAKIITKANEDAAAIIKSAREYADEMRATVEAEAEAALVRAQRLETERQRAAREEEEQERRIQARRAAEGPAAETQKWAAFATATQRQQEEERLEGELLEQTNLHHISNAVEQLHGRKWVPHLTLRALEKRKEPQPEATQDVDMELMPPADGEDGAEEDNQSGPIQSREQSPFHAPRRRFRVQHAAGSRPFKIDPELPPKLTLFLNAIYDLGNVLEDHITAAFAQLEQDLYKDIDGQIQKIFAQHELLQTQVNGIATDIITNTAQIMESRMDMYERMDAIDVRQTLRHDLTYATCFNNMRGNEDVVQRWSDRLSKIEAKLGLPVGTFEEYQHISDGHINDNELRVANERAIKLTEYGRASYNELKACLAEHKKNMGIADSEAGPSNLHRGHLAPQSPAVGHPQEANLPADDVGRGQSGENAAPSQAVQMPSSEVEAVARVAEAPRMAPLAQQDTGSDPIVPSENDGDEDVTMADGRELPAVVVVPPTPFNSQPETQGTPAVVAVDSEARDSTADALPTALSSPAFQTAAVLVPAQGTPTSPIAAPSIRSSSPASREAARLQIAGWGADLAALPSGPPAARTRGRSRANSTHSSTGLADQARPQTVVASVELDQRQLPSTDASAVPST